MYDKVSTDMNFVEREKKTEKFWADNQIFERVLKAGNRARPILFTTVRLPLTESHISATF